MAIGALLATALTGAPLLTTTAVASASIPPATYDCSWAPVGDFTAAVTHRIGATSTSPDQEDGVQRLGYGSYLPVYDDVAMPESVTDELNSQGVTALLSTSGVDHLLLGDTAVATSDSQAYPHQDEVPGSGPTVVTPVTRAATLDVPADAGDTLSVGLVDTDGEDLAFNLTTLGADGASTGTSTMSCELADDQDLATGVSLRIVKARTATTAFLDYDREAHRLVAQAWTKATDTPAGASGAITFVLERNGKRVRSACRMQHVGDGPSTVRFAVPATGHYRLVAKYLGDGRRDFARSGDDALTLL